MAKKEQSGAYWPHFVFAMLAWLIMAPLFRRGFVFALDMVLTPVWRLPAHVTASYPFYAAMHLLSFIVPGDVLQKVLLGTIFIVMGWGACRLTSSIEGRVARRASKAEKAEKKEKYLETRATDYSLLPSLFAGVLYVMNPYVYSRFMAGQFAVLMGYALLPWFAASLLSLLRKPGWRQGVRTGLWLTAVGIVSIHTLGLCGVLLIVAVCTELMEPGVFRKKIPVQAWNDNNESPVIREPKRAAGNLSTGSPVKLRMTGTGKKGSLKPIPESRIQNPASLLKAAGIAVTTFILASSYWLVPALLGKGATAETVAGFGAGDQAAFATVGGSMVSRVVHVLGLQGFWVEKQALYRLPPSIGILWWLAMAVVAVLVVVGIVRLWRLGKSENGNVKGVWGTGSRYIVLWLGGGAIIATILAAGIGTSWLSRHVPFFSGYREPHKFAGLVALAYAIFASSGVLAIWEWSHVARNREDSSAVLAKGKFGSLSTTVPSSLQKRPDRVVLGMTGAGGKKTFLPTTFYLLLIATPLLWSPFMLFGGGHQLHTSQYPSGWFAINDKLKTDHSQYRVLFLPWHLYMHFGFSGTIMANPAEKFFDKPVLASKDPELGGATAGAPDVERDKLTRLLIAAPRKRNLGANLAPYNVKYVIVANESDYEKYRYVGQQPDMKLVYHDEAIALYRNTAWKVER